MILHRLLYQTSRFLFYTLKVQNPENKIMYTIQGEKKRDFKSAYSHSTLKFFGSTCTLAFFPLFLLLFEVRFVLNYIRNENRFFQL